MERNRGYRFIFWGFVLLILHINFGESEILPSFIALLIVVRGISIVLADNQNKELQQARKLCYICVGVQFIGYLAEISQDRLFFQTLGSTYNSTFTIIFFALNTILNIAIIFYLFLGSEILLDEAGKNYSAMDLEPAKLFIPAKNLSKEVVNFVAIYTIGVLLIMPGLILEDDFTMATMIGAIIILACSIWVASNIASIRRQYPDYR